MNQPIITNVRLVSVLPSRGFDVEHPKSLLCLSCRSLAPFRSRLLLFLGNRIFAFIHLRDRALSLRTLLVSRQLLILGTLSRLSATLPLTNLGFLLLLPDFFLSITLCSTTSSFLRLVLFFVLYFCLVLVCRLIFLVLIIFGFRTR